MGLSIIYYAPTDTMGETSQADADSFRTWAKEQLQAEYPNADITVSERQSIRPVSIQGAESPEQEEDIQDFANRLWDRCPWDWD